MDRSLEDLMDISTTTSVLQRQLIQEIELIKSAGIPVGSQHKHDYFIDWLRDLREEDDNPKVLTQLDLDFIQCMAVLESKLITGKATPEDEAEYERLKVFRDLD